MYRNKMHKYFQTHSKQEETGDSTDTDDGDKKYKSSHIKLKNYESSFPLQKRCFFANFFQFLKKCIRQFSVNITAQR